MDRYTRNPEKQLEGEELLGDETQAIPSRWTKTKPKPGLARSTITAAISLSMLACGFFVGLLYSSSLNSDPIASTSSSVAVPQVRLGKTTTTFKQDEAFSAAPTVGEAEPAWDSLIPNGLGYVNNTELAPDFSVVAVFHQLHCLYTIRRAWYVQTDSLEDFDFGRDRGLHVKHCFEYLRQSLLCSADSSIEPAHRHGEDGFLGWDVPRQCYDYEQLKDWAEERRAFDAHGFLANELRMNSRMGSSEN